MSVSMAYSIINAESIVYSLQTNNIKVMFNVQDCRI